jgi:hypothetical protein
MVDMHHPDDGDRSFLGIPLRHNGALMGVGVLAGLAMAAVAILCAYGALAG